MEGREGMYYFTYQSTDESGCIGTRKKKENRTIEKIIAWSTPRTQHGSSRYDKLGVQKLLPEDK